ncbi:MAG: hypothetical protein IJQ97_02505, partial [Paludibacteraceae bacterium]|nr:hypothetical protein [Paludibacteraceae bacterium]
CDSIAGELRVVEQPVVTKEPENISIYQTQTYTWRDGREYSDPGTYEYIEYYLSGCDSVIYTLNLVVLDIEHTEVTVTDIVCPKDVYEGHAISEHTQWSDTVRTTDASGALVDVVTNYDIDVYDTTLPDGFMNFVVASCGLPVNADSASTLLDNYINSSANYAAVKNIRWEYSEDGGAWKALDGATTLGGQIENVAVRCVVETECGEEVVEQMYKVGTHATPEIFVEYDQLPVIRKFNGTMLMVDVDDICKKFGWTNGKEIMPEIVEWYMQVGELDNLSYPKADDPKDQPMNKYGYYYTPQTADTYYALIKGNLPVDNDNCGVWARTLTVSGNSPIQLQPNVAQGGATVTIEAVTQCYVTITDMYGNVVMGRTASSGTFKAPASAGTYFVTIESDNSVCHRTLIVY